MNQKEKKWIKTLKNKMVRKSKEEKLAHIMGFPKTKVCTRCKKRKKIIEYYFLPTRMVYRSTCKSCNKEHSKTWQKSEKGKKYLKEYTKQGKNDLAFKTWRAKNVEEHRKRNLLSYRKKEQDNIRARIKKYEAKIEKWKSWLREI